MDIGHRKIKYLPNGDWIQVRVDRSCGMSPSLRIPQYFFFLDIIVSCTNWSVFLKSRGHSLQTISGIKLSQLETRKPEHAFYTLLQKVSEIFRSLQVYVTVYY